ncbi:MAG: RloB family protein [Acidimicrobiaceae bacterium]|nr:RloB family protein [Acidimicrobiaceae bacterium]
MNPRHRKGKPLRRRRPRIDERKRYVIYCEGKVTEPVYLTALNALADVRPHSILDVRGKGYDPHRLVAEAKQARLDEHADEEAGTEYWCVFDVEVPTQHSRLHDAIQMARDNDIKVAISNPCFELWLILHHQDHTRPIDNQQARSILRKHDPSPEKGLDSKLYMESRKDAVDRARRLTERHKNAGQTFPDDNPSSGVYRLIEVVEEQSR